MFLERGQLILIEPHTYANGAVITQVLVDNVYDWGVRGYTYSGVIGESDEEGLRRIYIRVDWPQIRQVVLQAREYG